MCLSWPRKPSLLVGRYFKIYFINFLGTYTLRIDRTPRKGKNFNFIDAINNMAENCPSMGPFYENDLYCWFIYNKNIIIYSFNY